MTRTEAADLLDNLIGMVEDNQESDYDDALKMAIEALKTDGDTISRRAAIDALGEAHFKNWGNAAMVIKYLPSAQPERLTDDDFETIRIHLNAYKEKLCNQQRWEEAEEYQRIIDRFIAFASAQRKGKWIAERYMDEVDSCFYTRYKCSECGRIVYDSSLSYCHCGAEMKGEEDERIKNS